jgi:hypothetical protein
VGLQNADSGETCTFACRRGLHQTGWLVMVWSRARLLALGARPDLLGECADRGFTVGPLAEHFPAAATGG